MTSRALSRLALAIIYAAAGALHVLKPAPFVAIVPPFVPYPLQVVLATGLAELAGAIGLLQGWSASLRKAAACGLAAYALCVWPANVQHMLIDLASADGGLGLGYHVPRLALQPVLIWWPLWAAGIVSWPLRRRTG